MRAKYEGLGSLRKIPNKQGPHKQVRSLVELSQEVGCGVQSLRCMFMRNEDAPKPVLRTGAQSRQATYYDYAEFKKWWKNRQQSALKT